ncbi:MAG: leucine-rich repeat protein [Clostridia bacterium]|nr:leucine-rich repeat protein [Clostridia bacterium]
MKHIFKKGIAMLLSILFAFNLSVVSFAEDTVMSGSCGENAEWVYDAEAFKLTISGTGTVNDYSGWEGFKSEIKNIEISNGITKIGFYAFDSCTSLVSIELADSLVSIREGAFYNCTNLQSIEIPDGITKLEAYTFSGCTSLEKVIIPDSVVNVDKNAFKETASLSDVYYKGDVADWCAMSFNESIFSTGVNLYINGALIENLVIPDGITTIGDYTFSFCTSLKSVEMPKSLTRIGKGAFYNCTKLQSIEIPESVTSIGDNAFNFMETVTDVYYTGDIEDWCAIEFGFDVFVTGINLYINGVLIENLVIPDGVVDISDYAFQYCVSIKNIEFPKSIKTIGSGAFCHCKALTRVAVPEGVTILRPFTFFYCDNLSDVTLPKSLLSIEFAVFSHCTALESIIIPDNVEIIGTCAFNVTSLKSIVIPESMKEIGGVSFFGKDEFTTYYKGTEAQWNEIEISTANNMDLFKNIVFNYVATSGNCGENATWVFDGTSGTLSISGTGAISDYSGWNDIASAVTYVEIGNGITAVGEGAFNGFTALKEVYLAESVTELGADAFKECSKLAIVTARSDALSFSNAFSGNDSRLFFIAKAGSGAYTALKSAGFTVNGISTDKEKDGHKVLSFDGKTTIYKNLDYNYISNLITENSDAHYLYFDKITFDGIAPDTIIVDEENLDKAEEYFTLNEVYISVSVNGKTVTLPELVELLQSEDVDGIISFEQKDEPTIFEQISDFFENVFDNFITEANRVIISVINALKRLFRR